MSVKTERSVTTFRGRILRQLAIRRSRRRRYPLTVGIDVTASLRRNGRGHRLADPLGRKEFFEGVPGSALHRDAAPTLGAVIQPDPRTLREDRHGLGGGRRLLAHTN